MQEISFGIQIAALRHHRYPNCSIWLFFLDTVAARTAKAAKNTAENADNDFGDRRTGRRVRGRPKQETDSDCADAHQISDDEDKLESWISWVRRATKTVEAQLEKCRLDERDEMGLTVRGHFKGAQVCTAS